MPKITYNCSHQFCNETFETLDECVAHENDHKWLDSLRRCKECKYHEDEWQKCSSYQECRNTICNHPVERSRKEKQVFVVADTYAPENCPDKQPGDVLVPLEGDKYELARWSVPKSFYYL